MGMFGVGCFMMIDALGYESYTGLDYYNQFKLDVSLTFTSVNLKTKLYSMAYSPAKEFLGTYLPNINVRSKYFLVFY